MAQIVSGEQPIVLIFGADTPLGKRLAFYLKGYAKEHNREMTVVEAVDMPLTIERIQKTVWDHYVGDYNEGRPTLVINTFEVSDIQSCQYSPERAFTINSITAAHIALAARSASIPLIQISSDHVLGDGGPHSASATPRPINVYGTTKLYAERAVQTIYPIEERHPDRPPFGATIIRVSEPYGFEIDSYATTAVLHPEQTVVVPDRTRLSYSFIGEVAFVIARNIIDSPQLLTLPIIHVAAKDEPVTWRELLVVNGATNVKEQTGRRAASVPMPLKGGLLPTPGWFLSSGHTKQWEDFVRELIVGRYLVYW